MKKFPGTVGKEKRKKVLNDEQKDWLVKWYPTTECNRLSAAMGISDYKLHCLAREMGLKKSEKGLEAIRRRRDKRAAASNEKNGCYDRKRGHPVSAATMAGRARRFEEERLGLRENAQMRIKREDPERYKRWIGNLSAERRESIRKEKMRMVYGLERKTNIGLALCPYKLSQRQHRYNALRRGYVLAEGCEEGNPDRYIIYYDKETKRSEKFEANCIKDGFMIKEWVYDD